MYNREKQIWESQSYDTRQKVWCQAPENEGHPEALFMRADQQLPDIRDGSDNANAVYWMEAAAKAGHLRATVAMGELFLYGWGVEPSKKMAIYWYERAAAMGDSQAVEILAQLRKKQKRSRKKKAWLVPAAVLLLAGMGLLAWILLKGNAASTGVVVHADTELIQTTTQEEFVSNMQELLAEYDTEAVISGQVSTNRLMLKFQGSIDLSQFPADTVLWGEDDYLIVQFATEEEAKDCLEALRQMPNVLFVQEDGYVKTQSAGRPVTSAPAPNGSRYMSWGVEFLNLDVLANWIAAQQTNPVVVAVLDTGTLEAPEYRGRVLEGESFAENGNGQGDRHGHGTHVGSIILDCTKGLDVTVLPVQVLGYDGSGSDSMIVEGIKYAIRNNVDVINMSLGGVCNYSLPGDRCGSAEDYYISQAVNQGIVVVVAAGNESTDTAGVCPAHLEEAFVVSACDDTGTYTDFTNYGESVDVCAPGKAILNYGTNLDLYEWDGTSMAAPHISALAAMLRLYLPNKTPQQIMRYIELYSEAPGDPVVYGEGIPNAAHFAGN